MGARRHAREHALMVLYQVDLTSGSTGEALDLFWKREPADPDVVDFASSLASGVSEHIERIDALIGEASINWKVSRMSYVDRNILRVAVYEFLELGDVPAMVSINEAIELGKRFGTTESGSFINGILDKVARNLNLRIGEARP